MEHQIRLRYPVADVQLADIEVSIDFEDSNVVRYSAGYVVRALLKKVNGLRDKQKEELKKCLEEMVEGADESVHDSTKWTKAVDRGGLIHVNDIIYKKNFEMELVTRRYQKSKRPCDQQLQEVIDLTLDDEEVLFAWAIASASWQDEDASVLLRMITEHWITMRGFSFAKSLMELYKKRSKKNIQKTKGLRKQLPNQ